jgi:cytochrome c-type biogenesis protein
MNVTLFVAFTAGLISFVSPCVLPLLPGYLSLMSGYSVADLQDGSASWRRMMRVTLLFVAGFTAVFVALGAGATSIGGFLIRNKDEAARWAGWLVLAFGIIILLTAFQKGGGFLGRLMRERRMEIRPNRLGAWAPPLMGVAFGFAWTPCIGPVLGAILGIAATQETALQGIVLLLAYAAGLGVPFVLAGIGMSKTFRAMSFFRKYLRPINVASGALLAAFGLVMITGNLTTLSSWVTNFFLDTPLANIIEAT